MYAVRCVWCVCSLEGPLCLFQKLVHSLQHVCLSACLGLVVGAGKCHCVLPKDIVLVRRIQFLCSWLDQCRALAAQRAGSLPAGSLALHWDEWDVLLLGPMFQAPLQYIVLDAQTQHCFPLCAGYVLHSLSTRLWSPVLLELNHTLASIHQLACCPCYILLAEPCGCCATWYIGFTFIACLLAG